MFLRKKVKPSTPPPPKSSSNLVSPTRAVESTPTPTPTNDAPPPLFARFATQGQTGFGNEPNNKPVVSGPMTLVSRRESIAVSAGNTERKSADTSRARIQNEKPLPPPIISPEREAADMLSSRPSQSSLPLNRRTSSTPRTASVNGADSFLSEGPGVRRISTNPSVMPTSPPSPHPSVAQPAQAQAITRGADTASPQTLSSTRKSSPQDLRRKDSESKASYSGHNDAQRDNLVSNRPTNNKSYAPVDPHSSYRFASSKPPPSFNNNSNNNYGSPYSGKNDSFYSLPQANGSTASSWNPSNAYISPNLNHSGLNPFTDFINSNTNFNMGVSHSTAMGPGSGPFPSHASTTFKGMAAAAPAFSSPPVTFGSGMGTGTNLGRRMSGVNVNPVTNVNNLNNASIRNKGPLIFAAMTTVDVDPGSTVTTPITVNPRPTTLTSTSNSTRRQSYQATSASAYPSPPAEYASPLPPSSHSNKRFSSFSPPSSPSVALATSMPPTTSLNGNTNTNTLKRQSRRLSLTQSVIAKPQPPLPSSSSPVPGSSGPSLSSNMHSSGPAPNSGTHTHINDNTNIQTLKDSRRRSVLQKEKGTPTPMGQQQQYPDNGYANGSLNQTMSPSSPTAGPLSSPPVLSSPSHHRTLTKSRHSQQQRPTPPVSPEQPPRSRMSLIDPSTRNHSPTSTAAPSSNPRYSTGTGPIITPQEFEQSSRRVAIPLDEDPFARSGGVRMLSPLSQDDASLPLPLEEKALPSPDASPAAPREMARSAPTPIQARAAALVEKELPVPLDTTRAEGDDSFLLGGTGDEEVVDHDHEAGLEEVRIEGDEVTSSPQDLVSEGDLLKDLEKDGDDDDDNDDNVFISDSGIDTDNANEPTPPAPSVLVPIPSASQSYQSARALRRGDPITKPALLSQPLPVHKTMPLRTDRPAEPFPLVLFISEPSLVRALLGYLSYFDWCNLVNVSKEVKAMFYDGGEDVKGKGKGKRIFRKQIDTSLREALKEEVFERFLNTVGYVRWGMGGEKEPIVLTIHDLHSYMLGVTLPTFEYARIADLVIQQKNIIPTLRDAAIAEKAKLMVSATRAYNRVLMRLRAQAERRNVPSSQNHAQTASNNNSPRSTVPSRSSSRAPSPVFSVSHAGHGNGTRSVGHGYNGREASSQSSQTTFRSPLFRSNRAPLLRVFVPSPEGDWLSDASVLECEAELKRGNVFEMMRLGDVVWDLAVGEEGNAGRLIWDGSYLIDLDYTYSPIGDLPKYIPGFAFPPSYFHGIIRTGASSSNATSNPVIRLDISPWGPEVAMNLQLLQDRVRTETPQGSYHNVVRWVHRSSFNIRPPINSRQSQSRGGTAVRSGSKPRIPIPDSSLFIDPGWYGKVVVETEGTNEALADLQDRCGKGAFPPRVGSNVPVNMSAAAKEGKMVYRILRERSRPGEIWIRAVSPKERLI